MPDDWDDESLKELIVGDGLRFLSGLSTKKVAEMLKRLEDVRDGQGKMNGYL